MKQTIIVILIIFTLFYCYGRLYGTKGLVIKEYNIVDKDLPESFNNIKIVHFSDLHYGRHLFIEDLSQIIIKINNQKPDIVIFTGDLIDEDTVFTENERTKIIEQLNKIETTLGKYAVLGNHDYKNEEFTKILEESDFTLLDNEYELIYYKSNEPILISGLDDTLEGTPDLTTTFPSDIVIPEFRILLVHEPDYADEVTKYNYNLILSGHSHQGQVRLPLIGAIAKVPGAKKYYNNSFYQLETSKLYISSGIGTSAHYIRFLCKPSINIYYLKNKE